MKNVARLSDNDRRELFRNTADKMGLNDAIVEKDFWVCISSIYIFLLTFKSYICNIYFETIA